MFRPSTILASKSPRRERILRKIGINFEIIPSNISEDSGFNLSPENLAKYLSEKKVRKISKMHKNKIIIGADTIVYVDKEMFGKPRDKDENYKMLRFLSGKTHNVVTGVCIANKDQDILKIFSQTTKVTVRKIPEDELLYYIDNFCSLDKAGGYGIQDWSSVWIKKIDGCFYNVMGLPLSKFYKNYNRIKRKFDNV